MKFKILFSLSTLLIFGIALLSVAEAQKNKVQVQTAKVRGKLPTLSPLGESSPSQTKGGITIAIAPVPYQVEPTYLSQAKNVNPSFKERLTQPDGTSGIVERTCIPAMKVVPDRLRFQVTMNNQLSRVFHGAGMVVQFNIAGKLVPTDAKGYSDFVNSIIPPRSQQQFEIYGPELKTLPDVAPVSLSFFDVVTNVDDAGNVSAKQNFQWDFQYAVQLKEDEVEVPPVERLWIIPRRAIPACVVAPK